MPTERILPADVVRTMDALLPCQSKEVVMETLGISSNTWLKVKRGMPVRDSLAERLVQRFGRVPAEH